jgi:hypothetical protein
VHFEEINIRVEGLACPLRNGTANREHLKLVTDDEDLCDNANHNCREETRELEEEVVVDENGEPQEHDDSRGPPINDVPDDEGENHGHDGAADSAKEAEYGLTRGY